MIGRVTQAKALAVAGLCASTVLASAQGVPIIDANLLKQNLAILAEQERDLGRQQGRLERSNALLQIDADIIAELDKLIEAGDLMAVMRFCVTHKLNILISGGTDTGKSVALRKIISMIPQEERVITIEDARELFPDQPNTVSLIADRGGNTRTPDMLLEATLRMRPDRLIVGEVRGKEAMTFLEAVNTGHGGSMTTIHAETPELALDRLAIAAGRSDVRMSYNDLRNYILRTIDVIIQTGRIGETRGIAQVYIPAIGDTA